ncbi:MAG: hemerythrin family protein [Spirochaetes bacterium]|nr:hemerythrin family protein [Spirochaetota bacterium]
MAYYQWDPSLESGYEKVDSQHKQLVEALNKLIKASEQGRDQEEVFKTLEFLTGYVIMHFNTEEKLQKDYAYPEYLSHKQYHDDFKARAGELVEELKKQGPTAELVDLTTNTIGEWLLNHIKGHDLSMVSFIKSKGAS